jgi:hypothetical protein
VAIVSSPLAETGPPDQGKSEPEEPGSVPPGGDLPNAELPSAELPRAELPSAEFPNADLFGGDAEVSVAAVLRDGQGVPISLTAPVEVGASLRNVQDAVWQSDNTLAVVAGDAPEPRIYWVGVGGLDGTGGLPQQVPGRVAPRGLTASVGTGNILAIDPEQVLHLRQSSALWPVVGSKVDLVAYPG